jgi:hypothetical protein
MGKKRASLSDNAQPLALLRSWLHHHNITFSEGLQPPTDLLVGDPPMCVHVTTGRADAAERLEPPGVNVDGFVIYYGGPEDTAKEFRRFLRAVGVGADLRPFDRGVPSRGDSPDGLSLPIEGKVKRQRDGEELILFRHDRFRRAPNPTAEQVSCYENVVGMAAKVYWKRNRYLLQKLHFEYEEALSYAWVWATTYIAHFELPAASGRGSAAEAARRDENQKLMHAFLQQHFWELWRRQERHLRALSMFVGNGAALDKGEAVDRRMDIAKALHGVRVDNVTGIRRGRGGGSSRFIDGVSVQEAMAIYLDIGGSAAEADGLIYTERELEKRLNRERLEERLLELPHDEMVRTLTAVTRAETAVDIDARRVAMGQLRTHKRKCVRCRQASVVEVHEQPAGVDALRGAEAL